MKPKLAIITSHPIQYNAPLFRMLALRAVLDIRVFYTWGGGVLQNKYDPGFNKIIEWDIPLLEEYDYVMVKNTSRNPGSHHYKGIVNPDLNDRIESWGATAILVFGWNFKSHLACMRHFHGKIPVLFRGDSTLLDIEKNLLKNLGRKMALRWIYQFVDVCLYTGKSNRSYFEYAGKNANNLVFAPHSIDNDRFSGVPLSNYRQKLGIPEDATLILFAGKFVQKKNPYLLIKAFSIIDSVECNLLMVGNGPEEEALKLYCQSLPARTRDRIHFLGFQNQKSMPDLYKSCDVFVLPSKGPGETWGLAINEAMAASKAIIASDKCGASHDLIIEGYNGHVFHSNNETMLYSLIKKAVVSKQKLKEMGENSFRLISRWNIQQTAEALESAVKRFSNT